MECGHFPLLYRDYSGAFAEFAPETLSKVRDAFSAAETDLGFTRLAAEPWSALEDISIDYAVMERAPNLSVMPYGGSWSDLGDWQAIWREGDADERRRREQWAIHGARLQEYSAAGD